MAGFLRIIRSGIALYVLATLAAAPAAGAATVTFDDKKDNVHFNYSDDWKPKEDKDYVLRLVPAAGSSDRAITFDVPELPFHIPGMIPLGMVANGYVDDMKKQHADLHVDENVDHPMPGAAKSKLVRSSWKREGKSYSNVAILMIHGDQVFILAAEAEAADLAATREAFDKIAASIQWTK